MTPRRCKPRRGVGRRPKACRTRSPRETRELATVAALSDAQIEELVAKHSAARKAKDFKTCDAIRAQLLAEQGVMLENTKDGVRWKRR